MENWNEVFFFYIDIGISVASIASIRLYFNQILLNGGIFSERRKRVKLDFYRRDFRLKFL